MIQLFITSTFDLNSTIPKMDATMKRVQIPGKESASIAYHLFPATAPTTRGRMVVFLNGMMGPQMTWHPVIKDCLSSLEVRKLSPIDR